MLLRMAIERQLAAQRLGLRLAESRARMGLTQEDAAQKIGVTHRAYQRWEAGEAMPYGRNITAAAEAFGLTVDELMTGGGDKGSTLEAVAESLSRIEARLERLEELLLGLAPGELGLPGAAGDPAHGPGQPSPSETPAASRSRGAGPASES